MRGGEDLALPVRIASMIGKLHRVDRPDLETQALQRKDSGRIADMAIGDMGLNRQDGHGRLESSSVLGSRLERRRRSEADRQSAVKRRRALAKQANGD